MKNQPVPFELKRGVLLDAVGNPVDFTNVNNLVIISDLFSVTKEIVESTIDSYGSLKDQFQNRPRVLEAVDYELESFTSSYGGII